VPITLSSQAFRRVCLAAATVTLSIVVAACGASFNAQTSQPYQPAEGTNADSGSIAVRNMLVLAADDGKGELHAAIVNDGTEEDTLVSIESAPATAPVQNGSVPTDTPATVTVGNVRKFTLKPGTLLTLPPAKGQPVTVTGGKPGQMIKLTLTFAKAAPLTATVPVLTLDHYSPSPRPETSTAG
jgi:copper(I)-binding protein